MQILTSGSFINLDNREKVEQLIFTAKAIADSAVQTDGFVSDEENNRRLALEIWQGAEYMTREHEQARIQNIFTNNFLERLREIGAAPATSVNSLPENSESAAAEISSSSNIPKDEFLGFVTTAPETESREIIETGDVSAAANVEATESVEMFSPSEETALSVQEENSETEKPAVGTITLSEKEPYRWDDCTVTAAIQLLPVAGGVRKVVFSVRTHDFAPQISVVELQGATATPEQISPLLEKAFERYKADLPVKVMDKMKREKSAGKRGASKPAHDAKLTSPVTNSTGGTGTKPETKSVQTSVSKSENNQTTTTAATSAAQSSVSQTTNANRNKPSVKTGRPENSAQGNLFGF